MIFIRGYSRFNESILLLVNVILFDLERQINIREEALHCREIVEREAYLETFPSRQIANFLLAYPSSFFPMHNDTVSILRLLALGLFLVREPIEIRVANQPDG